MAIVKKSEKNINTRLVNQEERGPQERSVQRGSDQQLVLRV